MRRLERIQQRDVLSLHGGIHRAHQCPGYRVLGDLTQWREQRRRGSTRGVCEVELEEAPRSAAPPPRAVSHAACLRSRTRRRTRPSRRPQGLQGSVCVAVRGARVRPALPATRRAGHGSGSRTIPSHSRHVAGRIQRARRRATAWADPRNERLIGYPTSSLWAGREGRRAQ